MPNTRSDTSQNTGNFHKTAVRAYLRAHGEVASKEAFRAGTSVPAWYITQIAAEDTFYTSLNHNGKYVASKHIVGHRSTHDGFWRREVDDGTAIFHRKETTKATLTACHRKAHTVISVFGANGSKAAEPSLIAVIRAESNHALLM